MQVYSHKGFVQSDKDHYEGERYPCCHNPQDGQGFFCLWHT